MSCGSRITAYRTAGPAAHSSWAGYCDRYYSLLRLIPSSSKTMLARIAINPNTLANEMKVKLSGQGSFHWPEVEYMSVSSHNIVKEGELVYLGFWLS